MTTEEVKQPATEDIAHARQLLAALLGSRHENTSGEMVALPFEVAEQLRSADKFLVRATVKLKAINKMFGQVLL